MATRTAAGPRQRLLEAAEELTYSRGMNVGVDAILKRANVARRSLYEHFGGKDGLVTAVLERTTEADERHYRETMDAAGDDPRKRLLAVFDGLEAVIAEPTFRGCRYLSADLALADPDHPAHAVTREYRRRITALLEHELTRLRHRAAGRAAAQLFVLIDGALAAGATRRAEAATGVGEVAELIIDAGL
ncbi:TetR/AcrR family transcriptional regulator [Glycomyces albidus]|jgi:AcrR family transcriptional regulator|uniref:TetR family transcriptional regulator n=1 Tax=Glycomyces albidus TaxID=2656774 RepID=A0A6L5G798_9ACTN|nr:TetR/AcrR family transcriptional regulator [Glycomyces albidus]MQM25529.1 TetR family transcriptional regulator [Glycomyces albidus]